MAVAEIELDRVAHAGAADQRRQVAQPVAARAGLREQAAHPVGDGEHAARRQLGDREVGHRVAVLQAEQAGQRGELRVGRQRIGLGLEQRHHQVEQRVVEFVGAVGRHAHVARRGGAGQLQAGEREAEHRALGVAGRGGQVDVDADAAQPRLARHRRRGIDGDRRADADAPAGRAEQQRLAHARPAVLVRAEQRHRQRGGRGRIGGAEAQAQADVQAVGAGFRRR